MLGGRFLDDLEQKMKEDGFKNRSPNLWWVFFLLRLASGVPSHSGEQRERQHRPPEGAGAMCA